MNISKINKKHLSGLILCGGAATRLGGEDKGLKKAKVGQTKPLIEHQLDFLKPQVSSLAISANRNFDIYKAYGFPIYQDPCNQDKTSTTFDGPLQGVLSGLKHCQTAWLYVQPIDTPNLPSNAIEQILASITENKTNAYYLASDERKHYLHLLLHRSCYDSLNDFVDRGERRAKTYLEEIKAKEINLGWDEEVFMNLNDSEDYQS